MLPTRVHTVPGEHSAAKGRQDDARGSVSFPAGTSSLFLHSLLHLLSVYPPPAMLSPPVVESTLEELNICFFFLSHTFFHPQNAKWKERKEITLADFPTAGVALSPGSAFPRICEDLVSLVSLLASVHFPRGKFDFYKKPFQCF